MKIYINETFNPLASHLNDLLQKDYTCVANVEDCDIMISMAYHSESDINKMDSIGKIVLGNPTKKVIFLSWFDFIKQRTKYAVYYLPNNPAHVVMNPFRYQILQLPISKNKLYSAIDQLKP